MDNVLIVSLIVNAVCIIGIYILYERITKLENIMASVILMLVDIIKQSNSIEEAKTRLSEIITENDGN